MTDPRTPVIVGVAQSNERSEDSEPVASMAAVGAAALERSGAAGALAARVGSVRVLQGLWSYRDAGRLVAEQLGLRPVQTTLSPIGGNEVYDLVNTTASDIQAGRLDVAVVCAAEVGRTLRRLRKRGERGPRLPESERAAPDLCYGSNDAMQEDDQVAVAGHVPANFYAMVESAVRHARDERPEVHLARIAALWSRASEVAVENPWATVRRVVPPEEILTASDANRPIASPYTKLMVANIDVDMAAAVVVCSLAAARAARIPDDALVFLAAGAGAKDHGPVTERWALHESPAMRATGQTALALAGRSVEEVDDLDLYSCFPSAVEVAQDHLGVDPLRSYTVTGGLTFAGGPLNSYCLHALATATDRIAGGRSASALLTGNGGYFSKHSGTVLAAVPPAEGYRYARPQAEVDRGPRRRPPSTVAPTAAVEASTVTFDRDGRPAAAIVTVLDAAGGRHWATSRHPDVVGALATGDRVGATAHLTRAEGAPIEIQELT